MVPLSSLYTGSLAITYRHMTAVASGDQRSVSTKAPGEVNITLFYSFSEVFFLLVDFASDPQVIRSNIHNSLVLLQILVENWHTADLKIYTTGQFLCRKCLKLVGEINCRRCPRSLFTSSFAECDQLLQQSCTIPLS